MSDTGAPSETRLAGQLTSAPGGPVVSTLLVLSGVALVRCAARLTGQLALSYRRPAELCLTERGLEISHRTELLGKVLKDSATLIPLQNLASITREVRYARLGMYAGLGALVLGTYVGAGLLVDGVRVPGGSPSLLGLGLAAIGLGVLFDFLLAVVIDAVRKTCRVIVKPYHGRPLCIQGLDPAETDRVLARVAERAAASPVA
jgi:hypothetical protein